jgi:uncharacterized protein (TIGR00369 family)
MEFDPARFLTMIRKHGHNALLGIEYRAHGDDWVDLCLPYTPQLVGDPDTGVLASGPVIALMDMATSISIWVKTGLIQHQATLDLRVDYLRPATPGKAVIGRGQCYRVTRNIAFIRGQAHDGDPDDPLAHVAGTYMFTGPPTGPNP